MLVIYAQSADAGAACLDTSSVTRQEDCKRVACVLRAQSGTWLFTLRGSSKGLRDGRSIVCAGASGILLRHSKAASLVMNVNDRPALPGGL
jgi:hypothetical protein